MKNKKRIVLSVILSFIVVITAVASGFLIHSNYEYKKTQKYLEDTSNPPAALKNPEEWVETFHDDFNSFDTTKWKNITFNDYNHIRRAAYYTGDSESVFTKDGKLYLRTEWKNGEYGEGWYSGYITTSKNKDTQYDTDDFEGFSQQGGYFEVRCSVPSTYSIWSSFWLMPENNDAFFENDIPNSIEDGVEVDILESYYYTCLNPKHKNSIQPVLHFDSYNENHKSIGPDLIYIPKLYNHFHTFGVLWDDDTYTFFLDGEELCKIEATYNGKDMGTCLTPEYIILSTEVMGSIKDGVIHEGRPAIENESLFDKLDYMISTPARNSKEKPHDFIIDYIRVYKKK